MCFSSRELDDGLAFLCVFFFLGGTIRIGEKRVFLDQAKVTSFVGVSLLFTNDSRLENGGRARFSSAGGLIVVHLRDVLPRSSLLSEKAVPQ